MFFTFPFITTEAKDIAPLSTYLKINHVIQDHDNYVWFAGHDGLTRFDGNNVINFSSYNEQLSIPFTWVHDITREGNHFIISTESHQLWQFSPETGETTKININLPNESIYNIDIYKGNYYFNTSKNVYVHSPLNKKNSLLAKDINISYIKSTEKNLYVAGRHGLYRLEDGGFTLILTEHIYSITPINKGILVLTEDNIIHIGDDGSRNIRSNIYNDVISTKSNDNQALLLNNKGEISIFSIPLLKELKHSYPKIEPLVPKEFIQDSSNTLWINSNKGLKKISPSSIKNHHKIYNIATNANEIELFNNDIVIGTYGGGIYSANNSADNISSKINPYLTLLGKKTMDLLAIEDSLYIATFDGVWVYNSSNETVKKLGFLDNNKIILKLTKNQNYLYIATNDNGFYTYNLSTKKIVDNIDVNQGISSSEIIDVMTLDNHRIWLATPNGIDIYNKYTRINKKIELPVRNKVISFATHNNKVYAATKGDGIFVLNFHGDILSRIAKGIDFSMISTINDEIWAPAQQGLYRINTQDNSVSLVPNTEQYTFTDRPIKRDNTVFIPHYTGLLEVPLTQIDKFNPKVSISQVTVSGESTLTHKNIEVKSENDVVSLSLASLDFRSGKDKKFKYQINSGKWNDVHGSQLTLTGLQSGIYKLGIRGTNSLGQWSDHLAYTEIKVAYPWYLTPSMKVFYIVTSCVLFITISLLLYLRFKSIRHIHTLLSNDIKNHSKVTFNIERNLIKAKELLSSDLKALPPEQLHQASYIINNCIDYLSKDENENDTDPKSIQGKTLEVALPYFINYIHQKYHCNIKLQIDIPESRLSQEVQADIYKIIYETIISTTINGTGRNFEISIQEFKQKIWLTITNDKNGFSKFKNKINFDMSMYYIRQIASKYNASFNVFDKEDSGCQLIISIPLMNVS
jgi:ligand-binding sensor domain-containing protein